MSAELVKNQSLDDGLSWSPEAKAIEEILLAEQTGEIFSQGRTRWLGRLLGVRPDDSGPVTERQFETINNQAHTLEIIDALPDLREAAQIKGAYPGAQKLGIGLWLIGWGDDKIAELFGTTKSAVLTARKKLADPIVGGRNHPQTIDTREAVDAARKAAAAAVLGSVAASHYVKSALPSVLKPTPSSSGLEKLKTYPAAYLLQRIETRYMEVGILSPESKGLLARHFLDTKEEMTSRERGAIAKALISLGVIRKQEELRAQLNQGRPIYEYMQFLRILVGDDRNKPISRATYVKKIMPGLERLASKSLEKEIAEDNHELDMVFSWLLTRKSRPPEPSRYKKARTKPFAGAKASEAS